MNGHTWEVIQVHPNSGYLIDRTNKLTLATTDPNTHKIYISSNLRGQFKKRVIAHEMGHAACFSYDLIGEIHRCCYPDYWVYMEEFICNFVADYGEEIFMITYQIIGDDALYDVPRYIKRMIA